MAAIELRAESIELESPTLVEGLPGVGLVGKIATDHLIDEFDMTYYASVHCEGLPQLGTYQEGDTTVRPPVRIYADEQRDLLALQSDVPISATAADSFTSCVTSWLDDENASPIYLSGLAVEEPSTPPELFGIATGDGASLLDEIDAGPPNEDGAVGGPTGALLCRAAELERDSVGLIVETNPQFPDPEGARVLIKEGVAPLAEIDVDVQELVEQADQIQEQREELARRLQETGGEESTRAQPLRMFQ